MPHSIIKQITSTKQKNPNLQHPQSKTHTKNI